MINNNEHAITLLKCGNSFQMEEFIPFYNEKEVVLEAVKQDGHYLSRASDRLKNDKDVVLEALKNNPSSLNHASKKILNDKEFILKAVQWDNRAYMMASNNIKNDKEIMLEALKNDSRTLYAFPDEIRELIGNKDPIETLEKAIKSEKFSNELEKSLATSQSNKRAKLKI